MESLFIDHVEVSHSLIEIQYWVSTNPDKESILFKIHEFENWLLKRKEKKEIGQYWDRWNPLAHQDPGHQSIENDIYQFLVHKIEVLSAKEGLADYLLSQKKPFTKVTKPKKSGEDTRTA